MAERESNSFRLARGVGSCNSRRSRTISNHYFPPLRPGRKDAVISQRVAARPRDEDGELFDQLRWLERDVRRPIAPWLSKPVRDPPIREFEEPLSGDRRPRNVPAQPFESFAITRIHSDPGVQAEALYACALLPDPRLHVLDLDAIAEPHDRHSGAGSCGNAMANRSLRAGRQQRLLLRQRVLLWRTVFLKQTTANQEPHDPLRYRGDHARDLLIAGRRERKDPRCLRAFRIGIHAIENKRVEVCVKVDRPTKSLDEGHRPAPPTYHPEFALGATLQSPEHSAQEDRQHRTAELVVIGQAVAKGDGKREHPLAHGSFWKDAIHKMSSRIGHAATRARRTETSPLTRERDKPIGAAGLAAYAQEPSAQDPALQKRAKLALHEARHRPTRFLCLGQEGLEVLLDHAIKESLLRPAA